MCVNFASFSVKKSFGTYTSNAQFAKNCWQAIGVAVPGWLKSNRATRRIKRSLNKPFAMEVIILVCWSIWCMRNGWLFQNRDPSIQNCLALLKRELDLVIHRTRKSWASDLQSWIADLA
jgi:hypothetical protein